MNLNDYYYMVRKCIFQPSLFPANSFIAASFSLLEMWLPCRNVRHKLTTPKKLRTLSLSVSCGAQARPWLGCSTATSSRSKAERGVADTARESPRSVTPTHCAQHRPRTHRHSRRTFQAAARVLVQRLQCFHVWVSFLSTSFPQRNTTKRTIMQSCRKMGLGWRYTPGKEKKRR